MFANKNRALPLWMWLLPLSFFAFQFILRLWPSLLMSQIMHQFAIDASAFGVMASVYYYGYAGMQIPIALLLERYGPRYVIFACALICGVATWVFSSTSNWYFALISRFLVGVGSAVGFLGTSKVISEWFSKEDYTRMVGFSFSIGLMGAIYGGQPISFLVEDFGWKSVAIALSGISLAIGFLVLFFLRSPKQPIGAVKSDPFLWIDFKQMIASPTIWLLAIANLLMVGSLEGFADVWGVNYLMLAQGLSKSTAAQLVSMIFAGMLLGGPILAILSKKLGHYTVIAGCGVGITLSFLQLLLSHSDYHWFAFAALFFFIGILCCYQVIVFAAGSDLVRPEALGVTIAFLNCINMLGGSFFHTAIGFVMDSVWTGEAQEGIRQYSIGAYEQALMLIPICALIGAIMVATIGMRRKNRAL